MLHIIMKFIASDNVLIMLKWDFKSLWCVELR